ncbi:hypothetical protein AMECASPLE_027387 [Ameca splendens]|uniref:Uncharacterized protein n=1 Tax=Ameca splendens TaxID=208324 RepID=A0ABV0Y500_9TELE
MAFAGSLRVFSGSACFTCMYLSCSEHEKTLLLVNPKAESRATCCHVAHRSLLMKHSETDQPKQIQSQGFRTLVGLTGSEGRQTLCELFCFIDPELLRYKNLMLLHLSPERLKLMVGVQELPH